MARRFLAFLFALAMLPWPVAGKEKQQPQGVPGLTWIRKVYLTGSKERAIKVGHTDLPYFTCLEPVERREDADAIVILSQSTYHMPTPDHSPSGIMTCHSTANSTSCMDTGSGMETRVTCNSNGSYCDVTTGYNLGAATLNLAGATTRALVERAESVAVLVDKSSNNALWQWDEGYDIYTDKTKGHGFYSGIWWGELNIAVGCGKPTINPHKHGWKPGQWPEPTPKPAKTSASLTTGRQ